MIERIVFSGVFAAMLFSQAVTAADDSVKQMYDSKCGLCHISGVANAPKLDDKEAWEARAAQGMDALLATAKKGKGAMPPMGTCMECSDEDLTKLIEYMISTATK